MGKGHVKFGRVGALAGIIAGVLIAVGVPAIALLTPQNIEGSARCVLTVIALIAGGIVTVVSAFFGIVIPKEVEGDDDDDGERKPRKVGVELELNLGKDKPKPSDAAAPPAGEQAPKA